MLKGDPSPWLLEEDSDNPGPRYFALRHLLDRPEDDPEVCSARKSIMAQGPVTQILAAQHPDGYWMPRSGKYQSTVWQIVLLAALGADPGDPGVRKGCKYVLDHAVAANHAFASSQPPVPSQAVHCMNGLLLYALTNLGFGEDERVQAALEWQAKAITGELPPDQYYQSGTAGPRFACGVNLKQPCGWGATKGMRALVSIPKNQRTPAIKQAIEVGVKFLMSYTWQPPISPTPEK